MQGQRSDLIEIFSSRQGEGPHTGEPMTFVRFAGCSFGCQWCDTDMALKVKSQYRVETPPTSRKFVEYANPITVEKLNEHLAYFTDPIISITGGEPLEHVDFLDAWLEGAVPLLKGDCPQILLETNGIFPDALTRIAKYIDIISMDIKLPSSTGRLGHWREHQAFLAKALSFGRETYIKLVLTADTSAKDLQEAIKIISSANKYIPVILQPVSPTDRFKAKPDDEQIQSFARLCHAWLPNVSVMPQMHKEAGWL